MFYGISLDLILFFFFFSSRRRHTRSVSAFLLNRSSDLASWLLNALLRIFAMSIITPKRKVLRMSVQDRKSGSAGMPRPISYAVFCLKKKKNARIIRAVQKEHLAPHITTLHATSLSPLASEVLLH